MMAPPPAAVANPVIVMLPAIESGGVACEKAKMANRCVKLRLRHVAHGRGGLQTASSVPNRDGLASLGLIESMSKVVFPAITESGTVTIIESSMLASLASTAPSSRNARLPAGPPGGRLRRQ